MIRHETLHIIRLPSQNTPVESPCDVSNWDTLLNDASFHACHAYGVSQVWIPAIAGCTFGIIAVESKFGRSPRYHLKRISQRILSYPAFLSGFAPRAQGIAQINQDRVKYLAKDIAMDHIGDIRSSKGAIAVTALGMAKAISLHYPDRTHPPSHSHRKIIAITHNAGWMAPRVARIQESLIRLGFLEAETQTNGFVGPMTLSALNLAATRFGCPSLSETIRANGLTVPPAWALTHPDLFSVTRQSDLFESLRRAAKRVGEDVDEPKFPNYRSRQWHTGWISSASYAESVLGYANGWERKKSITILGGSLNAKGR